MPFAVRRLLFRLVFYLGSVPFVLATPLTASLGQRWLVANVRGWASFHRLCARWLLGISSRIEGTRGAGAVLYAVKHNAMYETLELALLTDSPVIVLKQELMAIPLWGWAVRRYGAIVVDRDGSATMLRQMMREAKAARAAGRSVLIYPEGTRVAWGEAPPLRSGFAGLYRVLGLPVVPVAVDSGRLWSRAGPLAPGIVTIRFGDPIPPGLPREEIEARVHAAINALGESSDAAGRNRAPDRPDPVR